MLRVFQQDEISFEEFVEILRWQPPNEEAEDGADGGTTPKAPD